MTTLIQEISNSNSTTKTQDYINACNKFESLASEFLNGESKSVFLGKFVQEVSNSFYSAKNQKCEFSTYREALACQEWFNMAEKSSRVS